MAVLYRQSAVRRLLAPALALLAVLLMLTGCSSGAKGPTAPPLPDANGLLNRAATAMATVKSADVEIQVDPALTTIPIRSATGTLTAAGQATGKVTLSEGSTNAEFNFVITNGSLFLKGPTGPYRELPLALAASVYDPTALLDPNRGLPALLRNTQLATTEAAENVNGTPTYRIKATLNPQAVAAVVPGLGGNQTPIPAMIWVDQQSSRLVKAQLQVPEEQGAPGGPVTVTLSNYDKPVTINPPA